MHRVRRLRRTVLMWGFVVAALPSLADATNGYLKSTGGCAVWRVIDGDTISMRCPDGFERLRLEDIDTPERRGQCWGETWRALAATNRLRWAFFVAGDIRLPSDGPQDRYGRRLGTALVDGDSVSTQLIDAGLAVPYVPGDSTWCDKIEKGEI